MAVFYDTHAHVDHPEFLEEFSEMLKRARDNGIVRINSIGTDLESSQCAVRLSEEYPEVFAVVGWHPGSAMEAPDDIRETLAELASHKRVVALGEMGTDYFRLSGDAGKDAATKKKQASLFVQQLEVARELGLNVVVHQRSSFDDTLQLFRPFAKDVRAVFHCFVDDAARMREVLALGSIVSFTGIATFKTAETIRETIAATPSGSFMLETDSPYLAPVPFRGKRCEPGYVLHVAEKVAEIRGVSLDELGRETCEVAEEFFGYDRK